MILYLFLTEVLVVYSNLSILLLLFFCFEISFKTAVNSICLGTCSSCFKLNLFQFLFLFVFHTVVCFSKRVQKYNFFLISQEIFKVFLKIFFLFLTPQLLTNLSNNLALLRGANVTSISESHKLF